jgi:hypothetical protein
MYKVQLTVTDTKGRTLASITAFSRTRASIPNAIQQILQSEPIQSVPKTGWFNEVVLSSADAAPKQVPHQGKILQVYNDEATPKVTNTQLLRRNLTYTTPAEHMLAHPKVLQAHASLLDIISNLPKDVVGTEYVKQELHRHWWGWYDRTITPQAVAKYVDQQALTVRLWAAEWLMIKLEFYGFVGRVERDHVRNAHAGLRAGRINQRQFDEKMLTAGMVLAKLNKAAAS